MVPYDNFKTKIIANIIFLSIDLKLNGTINDKIKKVMSQ